MKWVEYLKAYTFNIKHKKGLQNKVVDALSKRALTIQEIQPQSMGIEKFKELYGEYGDFVDIYKLWHK